VARADAAAVNTFTEALALFVRRYGVVTAPRCPGPVASNFGGHSRFSGTDDLSQWFWTGPASDRRGGRRSHRRLCHHRGPLPGAHALPSSRTPDASTAATSTRRSRIAKRLCQSRRGAGRGKACSVPTRTTTRGK
jgi:hypothetical protein